MSKSASAKPETRLAKDDRENRTSPGLNWSLPSGQSLVEFALRSGFLAPPLLGRKKSRGSGRTPLRGAR